MGDRIIRADRRLRAVVLAMTCVGAVAGAVAIASLQSRLQTIREMAPGDPQAALAQAAVLLRRLVLALAAGAVALGAYTLSIAARTLRSGIFPPPGTRVIRDTKQLTGDAARKRAYLGILISLLMVAAALIVPYQVHTLLERLERPLDARPATHEPRSSQPSRRPR